MKKWVRRHLIRMRQKRKFKKDMKEWVELCKITEPVKKDPNKKRWHWKNPLISINYRKDIENKHIVKELKVKELKE